MSLIQATHHLHQFADKIRILIHHRSEMTKSEKWDEAEKAYKYLLDQLRRDEAEKVYKYLLDQLRLDRVIKKL